MQLTRVLCMLSTIPLTLPLASCGGGDNHLSQLEELDAAMMQVHAKEHADEAALARAEASGASAETIALLQSTVTADQAELNVIAQSLEQISPESGIKIICLDVTDENGKTTTRCMAVTDVGLPIQ